MTATCPQITHPLLLHRDKCAYLHLISYTCIKRSLFKREWWQTHCLHACSQELEYIKGVLFTVAFEFHFESEVCISVQPATLIYVLWPHSDKPVLTVPQIWAKLHDHVRKLVQVGPCPEILHGLVLKHADLLGREPVHLYYFQGLSVELKWELKLL